MHISILSLHSKLSLVMQKISQRVINFGLKLVFGIFYADHDVKLSCMYVLCTVIKRLWYFDDWWHWFM